jgi:uncharacterized SAM-binding protein YcdF (DUF218 family)
MFVFLSKFLPPLVYPLGLACLLMLLALILEARRSPRAGRLRRISLLAALLLLWLGGNRLVGNGLARSLEQQYLPPPTLPQVDAIVLLGGGTEAPEAPRPMVGLNGAGDRVLYAAELYRQGKAPVILVSGGLLDWTRSDSGPAADMTALLEWMGVPALAIWQQPKSRNTYEDALYCAEILRQHGAQRILLVTSAWHMPRSLRLFAAQGLEVIPAPTDFLVTDKSRQPDERPDIRAVALSFFPSVDNLALTTHMLKEYLGLLTYKIRGYY